MFKAVTVSSMIKSLCWILCFVAGCLCVNAQSFAGVNKNKTPLLVFEGKFYTKNPTGKWGLPKIIRIYNDSKSIHTAIVVDLKTGKKFKFTAVSWKTIASTPNGLSFTESVFSNDVALRTQSIKTTEADVFNETIKHMSLGFDKNRANVSFYFNGKKYLIQFHPSVCKL